MNGNLIKIAIDKLAFFGAAPVSGSPSFTFPEPTVGQMMYDNAARIGIPGYDKRKVSDEIMRSGLNVNDPARSLLHAGIGALAGNFISTQLNMGPFMRGVFTAAGANYGYSK